MALAYSQGMHVGTPAPDFSLAGVDGRTWSLASFAEAAVLVVVFTCNHCPYAIANEDRLVDLATRYAGRGVAFVAINPNDADAYPEDSFDAMRVRADERGFPFPYLRDETQEVARAYDAACTPDIFVFDADRRLVYNGRVDDNWQDPSRVVRHDLATAIEDALAGRALTFAPVAAMGCSIKWKRR
jgi:peroxiredoxin